MSLAVKPATRSPPTVPTRLRSSQTCQTHGEYCVNVMPDLNGGCIMRTRFGGPRSKDTGHRRAGAASGKADAARVWRTRQLRGYTSDTPLSSKFGDFSGRTPWINAEDGSCKPTRRPCQDAAHGGLGRRFAVDGLLPPGSGPANPSKTVCCQGPVCYWVGTTGTGIPAFEGTPFIVGQSAPNPVIFARLHGPAQTCLNDLTPAADSLCLFDLAKRRTGVPDGEEQLGILIQAGGTVTPCHQDQAPCIESGVSIMGVNSRGTPAVSLARPKP